MFFGAPPLLPIPTIRNSRDRRPRRSKKAETSSALSSSNEAQGVHGTMRLITKASVAVRLPLGGSSRRRSGEGERVHDILRAEYYFGEPCLSYIRIS